MITALTAASFNQFSGRLWIVATGYDNGQITPQFTSLVELRQEDVNKPLRSINILSMKGSIHLPSVRRILSIDFYSEDCVYLLIETNNTPNGLYYMCEVWEANVSQHTLSFIHEFSKPLTGSQIQDSAGIAVSEDKIYYTTNSIAYLGGDTIKYLIRTPFIYDNELEPKKFKKWRWEEYAYISDDDLVPEGPVAIDWYDKELFIGVTGIDLITHNELWCLFHKYPLSRYRTNNPSAYISDLTVAPSGDMWIVFYSPNSEGDPLWSLGKMQMTISRRSLRQVGDLHPTETFSMTSASERFPYKYCESCGRLNTSYAQVCMDCDVDLTLLPIWYIVTLGYQNVDVSAVSPDFLSWKDIGNGRILVDASTVEKLKVREVIQISYEINDAFVVEYVDDYIDSNDDEITEQWTINTADIVQNALVIYEGGATEYQTTNLRLNPAFTGEERMFIYADYQARSPVTIELHASPDTIGDNTIIEATVLDSYNNPVENQVVGFRFYKIPITGSVMQSVRDSHEFIPSLDPNGASNDVNMGYSIKHTQNPTDQVGRASCILDRHSLFDGPGHVLVVVEAEGTRSYIFLQDPEMIYKVAINQTIAADVIKSPY